MTPRNANTQKPQGTGPVEDMLAKELAAQHKTLTGRGPRNVLVRVLGDVVGFRFADVLTPLERSLLSVDGGAQRVRQLRSDVTQAWRPQVERLLLDACGVRVTDVVSSFEVESGRVYGVLCLDGPVT